MLYLSKELYSGWIKLQADKGLGRAYAGLLPFVEGLYRFGYISKEVYDENIKKYGVPLVQETEVSLSEEEQKQKKFLEEKDKQLEGMWEQWGIHPDSDWRIKTVAYAKKYPELEYAKLIIAKERASAI